MAFAVFPLIFEILITILVCIVLQLDILYSQVTAGCFVLLSTQNM